MELADLGKPFAFGRTAEVYNWGTAEVLKLYKKEYDDSTIKAEHRASRAVLDTGIPAPKVGNIIDIGDRRGIVFEKVLGTTMLGMLATRPWKMGNFAKTLALLQYTMHSATAPRDLPNQTDRLSEKIRNACGLLAPSIREQVAEMLSSMPKGVQMCHGDFHPDNVLITSDGPVIIDWIDATRGHPVADVARTSMLMDMAELPEETSAKGLLGMLRRIFHSRYLKAYRRLKPIDAKELQKWMIINAAARLSEGISEEGKLIEFIVSNLQLIS